MIERKIKLGLIPYGAGGPGSYQLWKDPEIAGDASGDVSWFAYRTEYESSTLRGNLGLDFAENRYTAARRDADQTVEEAV